jgi:hypothetical protein
VFFTLRKPPEINFTAIPMINIIAEILYGKGISKMKTMSGMRRNRNFLLNSIFILFFEKVKHIIARAIHTYENQYNE